MSSTQPECTCDVPPGRNHLAGCGALTPPAPLAQEQREFNAAWLQADPGQFGSSEDRQ